jgi:hypothetical protein
MKKAGQARGPADGHAVSGTAGNVTRNAGLRVIVTRATVP